MADITLRDDLDSISGILDREFEKAPLQRNYDHVFGQVCDILYRYGIIENPRNLRFRFILCMQEFFDAIPQEKWRLKDPAFIKESENVAKSKFREWVIEQLV